MLRVVEEEVGKEKEVEAGGRVGLKTVIGAFGFYATVIGMSQVLNQGLDRGAPNISFCMDV